jgi:hypothetical protein
MKRTLPEHVLPIAKPSPARPIFGPAFFIFRCGLAIDSLISFVGLHYLFDIRRLLLLRSSFV